MEPPRVGIRWIDGDSRSITVDVYGIPRVRVERYEPIIRSSGRQGPPLIRAQRVVVAVFRSPDIGSCVYSVCDDAVLEVVDGSKGLGDGADPESSSFVGRLGRRTEIAQLVHSTEGSGWVTESCRTSIL
jgi:hypothetical protein